MTDEEKAEEYIFDNYCRTNCGYLMQKECLEGIRTKCSEYEIREQVYLAGLKAGRSQWHKVADGDLPKDNCTVLVRLEKPIMKFSYFCYPEKKFTYWDKEYGCNVQLHNVIAWCEIPQFNSEE